MARSCKKIELDSFVRHLKIRNVWRISLYIDVQYETEIIQILQKNKNRFQRALFVLLNGRYHNDLYGKETISNKTKNITAFKFIKKREN